MKAIVVREYGDESKLILEKDVPKPKLAEDEVLIKVYAAGINPVDTYIRSGLLRYQSFVSLPYTPGLDTAGIVEEVGAKVTEFKKGDRVFSTFTVSGGYAEYTTAKAIYVTHLDSKYSFIEGASIGVAFYTAYRAIHTIGKARPGQTVLVHGASGGVGLAAIQIGRAFGLKVLGTAGTKEGLELIKKIGADIVFNHREKGYQDQILKATNNVGVDTIYEMLADVNLQNDLNLVKAKGKIITIGSRGALQYNPELTLMKELSVFGVSLYRSTEEDWIEMKASAISAQKTGWFKAIIARTYPLKDVGKAHHDIINNTGTLGKLVLDLQKN